MTTATNAASCCGTGAKVATPVVLPTRPRLALRTFAMAAIAWLVAWLTVEPVSEVLAYRVLALPHDGRLGPAVAFFAYDAPKVLLLLVAVVFVIGILNSYFTAPRARRILAGRREAVGNVLAALLGIVTPFCSCSAVPLFIGFVEAGIPLGVTFSFLVSAPVVNEVALVLLFGLFGWKVATLYVVSGLTIAIVSGLILGRLGLESWIEPWVREQLATAGLVDERLTFAERAAKGAASVKKVVGKTWPYVLAGIGVGAFVHGWVPQNFLASFMGKSAWWSVPLAVLIGVPMYASTATLVPVVQALLAKGAALGTALAFMMAVVGLSLPEFVLLRRVLTPRLLATFIAVVSAGILTVGWLFNAVL
jgi:uncharacterized membrane protein YraQ (UPF0718 family)